MNTTNSERSDRFCDSCDSFDCDSSCSDSSLSARPGKLWVARRLHGGRVVVGLGAAAKQVRPRDFVVARQPGQGPVLAEGAGSGVDDGGPWQQREQDEDEDEKDLLGGQQVTRLFPEFQVDQNEHHLGFCLCVFGRFEVPFTFHSVLVKSLSS